MQGVGQKCTLTFLNGEDPTLWQWQQIIRSKLSVKLAVENFHDVEVMVRGPAHTCLNKLEKELQVSYLLSAHCRTQHRFFTKYSKRWLLCLFCFQYFACHFIWQCTGLWTSLMNWPNGKGVKYQWDMLWTLYRIMTLLATGPDLFLWWSLHDEYLL